MQNVALELKNYQRKIRNQTQEIETYRYQNRLLQDQISNLRKTIDSFKKVHASNSADLTDSLHQEVLQEELSHKIKENCELHSKLECVCKEFHDKENFYLNQIDELKSKKGGVLKITSGGDVQKDAKKIEFERDFDKNMQKTVEVPNLKFDYKHFNFCLSLILPSFKNELNFKLEYFKPGYFTYILTQYKTSSNKSILNIITKSIDNCSLITDYLNDRQRQVAHNDNQNDAVVKALNQNEIISSLLNSLSKSKNLCEISEILDRLSGSVSEFVANVAGLELEDFCLGIGGAQGTQGDWKRAMKRLVQIKLGLRYVSTSLLEYCSIMNTRGVLKTSDVFVKPVRPEMVKTEEEVEHEIKLQFENAVSEKFNRIVAEKVNFDRTNFESDAQFLSQAEKMFWEQEANSLAARLAWESAQRSELLQKFSENDLQNKTMKEEMKQLITEFETKIVQNNETISILSEKADSFTNPMQSTSMNPFTSATNAVKNTFSQVQNSATKRPVLLSKIFK